ncbi:MAG: hypothetical protein Q8O30_01560 [Candidatus Omnitrophota bacterium]|nr:hypothetical protein [Candidatus Omnitrophota bacterium]
MLKKVFIFCTVICVCIMLIGISHLYAERKFSTLRCKVIMESSGMMGMPAAKTEKMLFYKGDKFREEVKYTATDGKTGLLVTLCDGQNIYQYEYLDKKIYVTQSFKADADFLKAKMLSNAQGNASNVGQEVIDGRLCDIVEGQVAGMTVKTWNAKDIDFPLKQEVFGTTTYYKDVEVDIPLDDKLFELPENIKVDKVQKLPEDLFAPPTQAPSTE